jgi:hypothetical protein
MLPSLGITEAWANASILWLAFLAGGSGACYAPDGEREGRSHLANNEPSVSEWERDGYPLGVEPPRIREAECQ